MSVNGKKKKKSIESKYGLCSDLFISHFQELGIHIPRTLPFLVEQELVIAAISTNGWIRKDRKKLIVSKCAQKVSKLFALEMIYHKYILNPMFISYKRRLWFFPSPQARNMVFISLSHPIY